ncbi:hypothetical protein PIB30_078279 [Stylosanthes scabra]|uniref:Uncharacterized protein n=1 Tax=Stylosanthes scabra TaxID=79078 RepID=A0ABU6XPE1_9FABA|nr:hypothetical protein [Stylosanthes scabra]
MTEGVVGFPYIATNEWQFCNFAVRFVPDRTVNVGVHFRVLNVFVIVSMFSFSRCVITDGAKPVSSIKLTARRSAQFELTAYPILLGKMHRVRISQRISWDKSRSLVQEKVGLRIYYGVRDLPSTFVKTLKSSIGCFHSSWREHSLTPFGSIVLSYLRLDLRPLRLWAQRIDSIRQESIHSRQRSVLATMSRRKTPAVKLKSVPRKDPPQLSQLPLRKWFTNKELWEDYQNFYSKMPILPPRFLSEGLLPEDKYPEFWELLNYQGLRPLLFT